MFEHMWFNAVILSENFGRDNKKTVFPYPRNGEE
jgi:hypothetical protein